MFQKKFLLAIALLAYSLFAHAGFEAEPNDTLATATPLKLNEIFTGNADYSRTSDFYKLELPKATEIKFHYQFTGSITGVFFKILNSNNAVIHSQEIRTINEVVIGVNLVPGIFYIQLQPNPSFARSNGSYALSAQSPLSVPRLITIPSVIDTTSLRDVNANGYEDLAILRILTNASTVVDVVDGYTQALIKRIIYMTDSRVSQPISITGFNDADNNGTPDIGVFFYNASRAVNIQIVKEARTGLLVKSFEEKASQ